MHNILRKIPVIFLLLTITPVHGHAQTDTDFWFVAPENSKNGGLNFDIPIYLRITAFNQEAQVRISQPANSLFVEKNILVPANGFVTIDLSPELEIIENKPANTILDYGLHIVSTNPVSVYYEMASTYCLCNPEIFSLKGQNALGTMFHIPAQNYFSNSPNYFPVPYNAFDIVATEDQTTVNINPSKNIIGHAAGTTFSIVLNKGQTYSAVATSQSGADHLFGSVVSSDKPVAITMSDDLLFGPPHCADMIGDQLIPDRLAGNDFIAVRGNLTNDGNRVFILAIEDNTNVYINGDSNPIATLNSGQLHNQNIVEASTFIHTDKPVHVLQVSGFGCELGGAVLPPVTCTGSREVVFSRTTALNLGIVLFTKSGNEGNFLINGDPSLVKSSDFTQVPGTNGSWLSASLTYSLSQIPQGSNVLVENNSGWFHLGLMIGDNGGGCSYGYFSDYNKYRPDITSNDFCLNDKTMFTLSDTSLLNSVNWSFDDPSTNNENTSNAKTPSHVFSKSGNYNVSIIYNYECGTDTLFHQVTIYPLPQPVLGSDKVACQGDTLTLDGGPGFSGYLWSDGATGQKTAINSSGNYTLTVRDNNNCGNTDTVTVTFAPNPYIQSIDTLFYSKIEVSVMNGSAPYQYSVDGIMFQKDNIFSNLAAGSHTMIVKDANNCRDSIEFKISEGVSITIPNAFSPNDDGFNDVFGPLTKGIATLDIKIYDRNGLLAGSISEVNGTWDGKLPSGKNAPQGIYYYSFSALGRDNLTYLRQGSVTLYRGKAGNSLSIVPNPVGNHAVVKFENSDNLTRKVSIINSNGVVIKEVTTNEDLISLDLSALSRGFYLIRVISEYENAECKFIKE